MFHKSFIDLVFVYNSRMIYFVLNGNKHDKRIYFLRMPMVAQLIHSLIFCKHYNIC